MSAAIASSSSRVACPRQGRAIVPCTTGVPLRRAAVAARRVMRMQRAQLIARASEAEVQEAPAASTSGDTESDNWVPVCLPEELPKGVRKEVEVDGRQVLLFWYRNQIYCIQARSPAEGAYSEGFIKAKFTQDYCIECPSTGSLFSLKDGSIVSWYPNNAVLRALTPQDTCKPLEMYPVRLKQEAIYVDVRAGRFNSTGFVNRGGSDTSAENNNVFAVQPTVYFDGMDPTKEQASLYMAGPKKEGIDPAVAILATGAVGALAVTGTAIAIYLENPVLLGALWLTLGGAAAVTGYRYINRDSS